MPMMTAGPQEKPLHELLTHALVDIYVGPDNTHWILHEKLLCVRAPFFAQIFRVSKSASSTRSFGLPDEDDDAFRLFVGWLYGGALRPPREEPDLAPLLELYLMAEKWAVAALAKDVLALVREYYARTDSFPELRRVQYVYANTAAESPMRALLVGAVARMLALGGDGGKKAGMPPHWEKALRNNGQLAVDIILTIQSWHLDGEKVPDVRMDEMERDVRQEDVKPKTAPKVKTEEGEQKIELREKPQTNGVTAKGNQGDDDGGHQHEDEDEDEDGYADEDSYEEGGEVKQEEQEVRQKLQKQLPNGVNGVNGVHHNPKEISGNA